jgi:hypothetical protein
MRPVARYFAGIFGFAVTWWYGWRAIGGVLKYVNRF